MKRPSMSTTRRPVVLLVQLSRDDSLEMYAEFLRYHGLAVIPVSDARDALMLAPQADIVVTGIILDDPMDGVELVSRLRHDDGTRLASGWTGWTNEATIALHHSTPDRSARATVP